MTAGIVERVLADEPFLRLVELAARLHDQEEIVAVSGTTR